MSTEVERFLDAASCIDASRWPEFVREAFGSKAQLIDYIHQGRVGEFVGYMGSTGAGYPLSEYAERHNETVEARNQLSRKIEDWLRSL